MRWAWMVVGALTVAALCVSGRLQHVDLDAAALGWGALGCVFIGVMWGTRWQRARRGYADWRGLQQGAKVARRAFIWHQVPAVIRWGLVVAFLVWIASLGIRSAGS